MLPIAPECSPVEETVAGRGQPRKEPLCTWTVCTHTVLCVTATCCVHPYWTVCTHIVLCAPLLDCVHPHCALWILTGLCAPIFCCVHPSCAVCTLTRLCAPTFYFCAYGCSAVWSHIIFVKAHKANIVKPNILTILGLLAAVHSRLCALCTFHNAQYGSYIMQDCLLFLYMDADVEKPLWSVNMSP